MVGYSGFSNVLAGVKVLAITDYQSGNTAARRLGELGADVIHVESIRGAASRTVGATNHFETLQNSGKRSIAINLRHERGPDLIRELVPQVDVFIENLAPDLMATLGLDYDSLAGIKSNLIYTSIKGYTPYGPNSDLPGFDMTVLAYMGGFACTGTKTPTRPGFPAVDAATGNLAASHTLAALYNRVANNGGSQHIIVPMEEVTLELIATTLALYQANKDPKRLERIGNRMYPHFPFIDLIECKQRENTDTTNYVYLMLPPRKIPNFWRAIGSKLADDPRFLDPKCIDYRAIEEEIQAEILNWTKTRDKNKVAEILQNAGLAVAPVRSLQEVISDPTYRERGILQTFEDNIAEAEAEAFTVSLHPWNEAISEKPEVIRPPGLGEHTKQILEEFGIATGRIKQLSKDGVILLGHPSPMKRAP